MCGPSLRAIRPYGWFSAGLAALLLSAEPRAVASEPPAQGGDSPASEGGADAGAESAEASARRRFAAGDYLGAKAGFELAYRRTRSPLAALGLARCQDKLNEWLEAERQYAELIAQLAGAAKQSELGRLRALAAEERAQLAEGIPRLRLTVQGARPSQVRVLIDGAVLPPAHYAPSAVFPKGRAVRLNPGKHRIDAEFSGQKKTFEVRLGRGQLREAALRFADPATLRKRACRDRCWARCRSQGRNSPCYLKCKQSCFQPR